jgi:hypothetical protein
MPNVDTSERAPTQVKLTDGVISEPSPLRWELWVSATAATGVILVIGTMLLTLTAELRAGWVPGHERPMDKATAIHKLLFRS